MTQILKNITVIIAIILSFFISGNPDNVTTTVNDVVTSQSQTVSITVKNETGKIIRQTTIKVVGIQQKVDNEWKSIASKDIPESTFNFYPGQEYTATVTLSSFDIDSLAIGEYRFVLPYTVIGSEPVYTSAYAYFTVDK